MLSYRAARAIAAGLCFFLSQTGFGQEPAWHDPAPEGTGASAAFRKSSCSTGQSGTAGRGCCGTTRVADTLKQFNLFRKNAESPRGRDHSTAGSKALTAA